jgi:hypothetical protein
MRAGPEPGQCRRTRATVAGRPALGAPTRSTHDRRVKRHLVIAAIGAGSMVAAWLVFDSAFSDWGTLGTLLGDRAMLLVPVVVIAAGVVGALVDRGVRAYVALLAGAVATVIAFAGWNAAFGPGSESLELAAIGTGLAVTMLSAGFVPVAVARRLVDRSRRADA